MASNPKIVVEYVADTDQLKKGFNSASQSTSTFGSRLKSVAKGGALAAGAAGVGALVYTLKTGISEWQESTKVAAQTQAVIKSTGKAANVTAQHVSSLAESLMKKSGVDDEAIASGENLLLTFTQIRNEAGKGNDVFDQATKAALDMSVALETDMKTAAMTLGKALNDPIKGMTKLTKQGVTFTDAQKKQAEAMVASGDVAGAQALILKELNKEFGGSAEAAGKTLPGQLAILKESFNNFAGAMVGKMIPVLQETIAWLRDHWPEISAAISSFWATVQPVLSALGQMLKTVATIVVENWPTIQPIVAAVGQQIKAMAEIAAAAIKLIVALLQGDWAAAWTEAKNLVSAALDFIKAKVTTQLEIVKAAITVAWNAVRSLTSAVWNAVVDNVSDAVAGVRGALTGLKEWIASTFVGALRAAVGAVGSVFDTIADGARDAYAGVRRNLDGIVNFIEGIVGKVRAAASAVANAIKAPINAVLNAWNSITLTIPSVEIPSIKIGKKKFGGGSIGGQTIAFPNVPTLAQGGIVTSPTLALIGERGPEAVVPLGDMPSPAVEVRVFIGDTELKGIVRSEIVDANTGIARTLLAGAA